MTAFGPAPADDSSTCFCSHSDPKAMSLVPMGVAWLKSSFAHNYFLK